MSTTENVVAVEIADLCAVTRPRGEATHLVRLKAKGSDRYLSIFVGPVERAAIARCLEGTDQHPRRSTHHLIDNLVRRCGGRVVSVAITGLVRRTYHASVTLETASGTEVIDARPSDALSIAALTGAPITVDPTLLAHFTTGQLPAPQSPPPAPDPLPTRIDGPTGSGEGPAPEPSRRGWGRIVRYLRGLPES